MTSCIRTIGRFKLRRPGCPPLPPFAPRPPISTWENGFETRAPPRPHPPSPQQIEQMEASATIITTLPGRLLPREQWSWRSWSPIRHGRQADAASLPPQPPPLFPTPPPSPEHHTQPSETPEISLGRFHSRRSKSKGGDRKWSLPGQQRSFVAASVEVLLTSRQRRCCR